LNTGFFQRRIDRYGQKGNGFRQGTVFCGLNRQGNFMLLRQGILGERALLFLVSGFVAAGIF